MRSGNSTCGRSVQSMGTHGMDTHGKITTSIFLIASLTILLVGGLFFVATESTGKAIAESAILDRSRENLAQELRNSQERLVLLDDSVTVRQGNTKDFLVGVYNDLPQNMSYTLRVRVIEELEK